MSPAPPSSSMRSSSSSSKSTASTWVPPLLKLRVVAVVDDDFLSPSARVSKGPVYVRQLWDNNSWDINALDANFSEAEVSAIHNIPIPMFDSRDSWMWHFTKDGRFSVRSAYNLLTVEQMRDTPSSSNGDFSFDWKLVWNVEIPQKIKCLRGVELKMMWMLEADLVHFTIAIGGSEEIPRGELHRVCLSVNKSCKDLNWWSLFWSVAWGIWLRHNGWTFEGKRMVGSEVIHKAMSIIGEFELAKEVSNASPPAMLHENYCKPPSYGVIKINSDAALFSPHVGLEGVMRDMLVM
ncbi:uncharacterized protein LOC110710222 [Chenopodium quinoa]|uniref:uncharacterized protein LOC110710222 n=1 Tax=Chenopodium quinoa TaxID=63459 RepID=UPI000B782A20|nr:uncharacterized protein LOC110710222 [Chenopodium quinoa]